MEQLLKIFGIDFGSFRLAYQLGRDQGRMFIRGALIFPGIRISDLHRRAAATGDDVQELIDKRDRMLDAVLDFLEEFADLDND